MKSSRNVNSNILKTDWFAIFPSTAFKNTGRKPIRIKKVVL